MDLCKASEDRMLHIFETCHICSVAPSVLNEALCTLWLVSDTTISGSTPDARPVMMMVINLFSCDTPGRASHTTFNMTDRWLFLCYTKNTVRGNIMIFAVSSVRVIGEHVLMQTFLEPDPMFSTQVNI